ncbi:MAG: hypothetical protein CFE23_03610 [Flavobacterium sp. BFFFF1]|uniref:DUF7619 domain-containing protein n=1 Tax=Flavobacterium sp. BFFFF1 TaxID=2015557 RepID=UPI000BCF9984|nr:T9SS type A sorting domain-containing protein [Flavobacterium sp. BFFFF1]OYU81566.1 MAG: hypothetical protein CFE23_03610 [Flavobacterium sp. BFFFF1]
MKKLLLSLLFLTAIAQAQIVNIPDANFKAKLISLGKDLDNDGEIQLSEAQAVTDLPLSNSNISNLEGITAFVNLQNLNCNHNNLQLLDVSGLANLFNLNVSYNTLTDLNLAGCFNLNFLNCSHNQINTLNVSDMQNLDLVASFNNLTTIVLNAQGTYTSFQLDHNQLTSIDLSNLDLSSTGLLGVHLEYNNLTSISLNETKLYSIRLQNNNLITINLNKVVGINSINLSDNPNLTSIFAKNGANEEFLGLSNDLNLVFICADEFQIQDVNADLNIYQIPNAVVSPYCIFQPGGNFNTITGNITFDADNNGCDSTDPDQPYVKLNLTSGNNNYAVFTSPDGTYNNFGQAGTFNVSVAAENMSLFTITPPLATILFGNANNNISTQDFCITANGIQNDLETVIVPLQPARPGFDAHYKIIYKNKGNQVLNGNIDFNYPENVSDFVNATVAPAVQGSGILSWNFFNLYPFESRSIEVTLNVNGPTETPAVNIGDQLNFSVQANPIAGDVTINDNAFSIKQVVTGSYDPNDITCLEGEHVNPAEIGKFLHYNINFENTGTAAAENIVVKDMIDLTKYDISSLQMLNASHPVTTRITNDKVEFIFENINLGASAHGNVTFKIKTKNTLVTGNSVSNKADIFFDYNFPIATNTAMTTFDTLGIDNQNLDNGIRIYPNPTNGVVNIKADSEVLSVELFDVRGRKLMMKNNVNILNISGYNPGIYFVKVNTDQGSRTQKLIKQ